MKVFHELIIILGGKKYIYLTDTPMVQLSVTCFAPFSQAINAFSMEVCTKCGTVIGIHN